jgi:hypothetical protein
MLPDFPRAKKAVHQYFFGEIGERRSQGPLLDSVRNITVYEGNDTQPIEARFEVRDEDLIRDGYRAYQSKIDSIVEEFVTQKEKLLIRKVEEATEAMGNVVDAKGQGLSPPLILNVLEKMDIDFDDKGKPKNLVLVIHPTLAEGLSKKAAEWEKNPEYAKAFAELMDKKRKEWRDRENSRKLVD